MNTPRIYTGIAQIMACFLYSESFLESSGRKRRILITLAALVLQCTFLHVTATPPGTLWLVCMAVSVAFMYLYLVLVCPRDRIGRVYMTIGSFILSEFVASAEWGIYYVLTEEAGVQAGLPLSFAMMASVYTVLFLLIFLLEKRLKRAGTKPVYTWHDVFVAGSMAAAVFAVSNVGFLVQLPFFTWADLLNTRTLVDLGGMAVLYAFRFRVAELQAGKDLAMLGVGQRIQYDNFLNYQETLEQIHIRYHDLKHQAMLLRNESDPDKRREYLDELDREIAELKPQIRTGNHVLDIILAGEEMKMKNAGIQFTCVADGKTLENIQVADICAIFGNALDNAIEYAGRIEDPQKRVMSLNLSRRKGFIFLEISNYCEDSVPLENGLPVTTKKNRELHGYGARSMVSAARKYGGFVTFEEEDHFFVVRVLIPET